MVWLVGVKSNRAKFRYLNHYADSDARRNLLPAAIQG